jgi:hypothetical protein
MGINFSTPSSETITENDSSTYVIDLTQYGITEGLPSKTTETIDGSEVTCYSDVSYTNAHNNVLGIYAAIEQAVTDGYRNIVMPCSTYSVCYSKISNNDYENSIVIKYDNITFNGNGSTFKVIYDSAKRSPYDKKYSGGAWITNDAAIYAFTSNFMVVRDCNHVKVNNCIVIGDKADRDFTIDAECAVEGSYGICVGGNCFDIDVEHNDVSFFMGDGFTNSTSVNNAIIAYGYTMGFQLGTINSSGDFASSTTYCVSNYVNTSAVSNYFIQGYGTTQGMTDLTNKKYTVHCYTSSDYICTLGEIFVLRGFTTPASTTRIRTVVEESSVNVDGWHMMFKSGMYGEFIKYRKNKIHHNHRGGMTIGVNDMVISENWFYNNGESYDYEYSKPGFGPGPSTPSSTRYHINMEDSQGFNITIEKNFFENGYLGVAIRGWNCVINNNVFKNETISFYRLRYLEFKNNYLDNSNLYAFEYSSSELTRNWDIDGNTIDGTVDIEGTAIIKSFRNNIIRGRTIIDCLVRNFYGNTFEVNKDTGFNTFFTFSAIPLIEKCNFIKGSTNLASNTISFQNALLKECTFERLKVGATNTKLKTCTITDCSFNIGTGYFKILDNSSAVHSSYTLQNYYPATPNNNSFIIVTPFTAVASITIKDSTILSLSSSYIFDNANSNTQKNGASIWIEDSTIEKQDYNTLGFNYCSGQMDWIRSAFTCEVTAATFTPATSLTHRFAECTFTNLTVSAATSDVYYSRADLSIL